MPITNVRSADERKKQKKGRRRQTRIPAWVDPFLWIQGSSIEKRVMAELVRRGVYFEHTPQGNTIGGDVDPTWEADFAFPQFSIWMEIQGGYFHTLPGAVERDALRFAIIEAAGWKPIFWWEDDIENRLQDIFNAVPEFYFVDKTANAGFDTTPGLPFFEGGFNEQGVAVDHLKGLRAALRARTRPPQRLANRRRTKRRRK